MSIILTSFKEAKKILRKRPSIKSFSVARFQPKGIDFPELDFLAATDSCLNKIKAPYNLKHEELSKFERKLRGGYLSRWPKIKAWLSGLRPDETIILACWCPESREMQGLLKTTGKIACHTGLIGKMIEKHRPEISLRLDPVRYESLIEEWRPVNAERMYPRPQSIPTLF